uniref:Uncharacterized protein n=1 Tax=Opuntia streptacantha TaxID=393608 RepID=A0A7C9DC32_OPUST
MKSKIDLIPNSLHFAPEPHINKEIYENPNFAHPFCCKIEGFSYLWPSTEMVDTLPAVLQRQHLLSLESWFVITKNYPPLVLSYCCASSVSASAVLSSHEDTSPSVFKSGRRQRSKPWTILEET